MVDRGSWIEDVTGRQFIIFPSTFNVQRSIFDIHFPLPLPLLLNRQSVRHPAKARPATASKPSAKLEYALREDPTPYRITRTKKRPKA